MSFGDKTYVWAFLTNIKMIVEITLSNLMCLFSDPPAVIVMVTELEDSARRVELFNEWDSGPYKQFHLLLVTKEEMKLFKRTDKGNE